MHSYTNTALQEICITKSLTCSMSKEKQAKFMDGEKGLISYNNVIYIYIYVCDIHSLCSMLKVVFLTLSWLKLWP